MITSAINLGTLEKKVDHKTPMREVPRSFKNQPTAEDIEDDVDDGGGQVDSDVRDQTRRLFCLRLQLPDLPDTFLERSEVMAVM